MEPDGVSFLHKLAQLLKEDGERAGGREAMKSLILAISFFAVFAGTGVASADTFIFPSDPPSDTDGYNNYRNLTDFNQLTLNMVPIDNALTLAASTHIEYTPADTNSPGWVDYLGNNQHTYVIQLPSIAGPGPYIKAIPYFDYPNGAVAGLLVLYHFPVILPTTKDGYLDEAFLHKVTAIVAFVPTVSSGVVFESMNGTMPWPIPEPCTIILLGLSLLGVIKVRGRIKK